MQGCAKKIEAECSVERDGSTLVVSANATYVQGVTKPGCITVCKPVVATCTTDPLPAGSYTIEYAGETSTLAVPSTGAVSVADGCTPSSLPSVMP